MPSTQGGKPLVDAAFLQFPNFFSFAH